MGVAATVAGAGCRYLPADTYREVPTKVDKYISFIQASGSSATTAVIEERS